MGSFKEILSRPFMAYKFGLGHDNPDDFYLGWWQESRSSPLPLLIIRGFLFLLSLSILITSLVLSTPFIDLYLIYLTHWGLLLINIATAYATLISVVAYFFGPIVQYGIPWYMKLYWVLYNVSIVIAFLITVFYWSFLIGIFDEDIIEEFEYSQVLDVFIHGINSVIVFLLLITSRHPSRYLHFYQPLVLGVIYVIFTVIYYFTGGVDMFGNAYVYPMLDWSNPWPTLAVVVLTALLIVVLHIVYVAMADLRDLMAKFCTCITCRRRSSGNLASGTELPKA